MATKYRKKPVEIEAMQWLGAPTPEILPSATRVIDWVLGAGGTARYHEDGRKLAAPDCFYAGGHAVWRYCPSCPYSDEPEHIAIDTLEGTMRALPGDWIIRGVQGEFYPCKPDIFVATYEEVL